MADPTPTHRRPPILKRPAPPAQGADWRCTGCNALLGRVCAGEVHIRIKRRHEYVAALPATCSCIGCGVLNRMRVPDRG